MATNEVGSREVFDLTASANPSLNDPEFDKDPFASTEEDEVTESKLSWNDKKGSQMLRRQMFRRQMKFYLCFSTVFIFIEV